MKEIRFSFDDDNNDSVKNSEKSEENRIDEVVDKLLMKGLLKRDDVSEYLAEFDGDDENEEAEEDNSGFDDEFVENKNTDIKVDKAEKNEESTDEKTQNDEFENIFEKINKIRNTGEKTPASRPPASRPPEMRFEQEKKMRERYNVLKNIADNEDKTFNSEMPKEPAEDKTEEISEEKAEKDIIPPVSENKAKPEFKGKKKTVKPSPEKNYYKDEIFDYEKSEKDREDDISEDEDEKDDIEYESYNVKKRNGRKRRKKRSRAKTLLLIVIVAAICAGAFLASPVFSVTQIEINDTEYFSKEDICRIIGLSEGKNGIFFNKKGAEKTLEANKYIASAEIKFEMPDKMIIKINENRVVGFIPYLSNYLYIDRYGRVLDIGSEALGSIPVIEGLKFSSFTMGQEIDVENGDSFESALVVSKAMTKFKTEGKTVRLNVSDSKNILAYIDNIKIILGDTSRIEEKIKTMNEAVKQIPEGDRGTLDLRDLNNTIIFKYST